MCPLTLIMFPIYFRYPKKISLFNNKLIIQTKLKKYEIPLIKVKEGKKAYTRSLGVAYKIKVSKMYFSLYLDSNSLDCEKLESFVSKLKSAI